MATPVVGATAAAMAVYMASRRTWCGADSTRDPAEPIHFRGAHQAPNNWIEALYFFAEALRYMYGETLGRWRTADLLIGLAYLARREPQESPVADIAKAARPLGQGAPLEERQALAAELRDIKRFMRCCRALKERLPRRQLLVLKGLGIDAEDVLMQESKAGVLKPSFIMVRDRTTKKILLAVRGTHSMKDMFTSLTGASKPHHMMNEQGVVLGHSHFGMLAAARWIMSQTTEPLLAAVRGNPGFDLKIMGHSLGGGTAALLTMMLRDSAPEFKEATCLAIACPACMTLELARSCAQYVTSLVNNTDIIPTISPGSSDGLREEVMRSAWYEAFRADMRSSVLVRAVEVGLGQVGYATSWTSNKLAAASQGLRACYPARQPLKRRSSGELSGSMAELEQRLRMDAQQPSSNAASNIEVASEWVEHPREASSSPAQPSSWGRTLGRLWSGDSQPQETTGAPPSPAASLHLSSNMAHAAASEPQPIPGRQQAWWVGGSRDGQAVASEPLLGPSDPGHDRATAAASLQPTDSTPISGSLIRRSLSMISGGWLRGCYPPQDPLIAQAPAESSRETADVLRAAQSLSMPQGLGTSNEQHAKFLASLSSETDMLGSPRGSSHLVPPPGQLDEEMLAVRAAVAAAEKDELQRLSRLPRNPSAASLQGTTGSCVDTSMDALPGIPFPSSGDPSPADEHHKRLSYPAGRVLHIVPARLLYPGIFPAAPAAAPKDSAEDSESRTAAQQHDVSSPRGQQQPPAAPSGASPLSSLRPSPLETVESSDEALSTAPFSPHGMDRGDLDEELGDSRMSGLSPGTGPAEERSQSSSDKPQRLKGHRRNLSANQYEFAPAEFDGSVMILRRLYPSDDEAEGEAVPVEVPLTAREQFLVLDAVPQEVYGRMRLCNTMLTDHFIPRYLANLETCIDLMADPKSVLAAPEAA